MSTVTFTRTTQTYNPTTGVTTSATSTVAGHAIRVRGDTETYRALSLIQSEAPTLLFTPATYGEVPQPGDAVTWAHVDYRVRDVNPLEPDGVVILARVIIIR